MAARSFIVSFLIILKLGSALAQVSLDHVISLTPYASYENTVEQYREDGFTIKKGKLHENGLLNNHIKFANRSYLELVTITGPITDEITLRYIERLSKDERAVFVALRIHSAQATAEKLQKAGIKYHLTENQPWNYITFPDSSTMSHVFLIEMKSAVSDTAATLNHKNSASGISEVVMYGDGSLQNLFDILGLKKEPFSEKEGDKPVRYITSTGRLILLANKPANGTNITRLVFTDADGNVVRVKNFN